MARSSTDGGEPDSARRAGVRGLIARCDPNLWSGALVVMMIGLAILWIVQIVNAVTSYHLDRYGLRPRQLSGLDGIVTMPFLHASFAHLLANSAPFVIVGWLALVGNLRDFARASLIIILGGGLVTWLAAPHGLIVGASALVFGWLGYLLARAYFARRFMWIVGAAFALFFFSGLFSGLVPSVHSDVSWQAHVAGFAAGVAAGWVLHPRKGSPRALRRNGAGDAPPRLR